MTLLHAHEMVVHQPRWTPRPIVAALLSATGAPLGQLYAGSLRRCVTAWLLCRIGFFGVLCVLSSRLDFGVAGLVACLVLSGSMYVGLVVDAWMLALRHRSAGDIRRRAWWVYPIAWAVLATSSAVATKAFRHLVAESYLYPSRSMFPTILAGDRVHVDKLWTDAAGVKRGDIVVFYPEGPGSLPWMHRVIGLPGDRIEMTAEQVSVNGIPEPITLVGLPGDDVEFVGNRLLVNGEPRQVSHAVIDARLPRHPRISDLDPVVVPEAHFFVLGDNRRVSKDSRVIGPVPFANYIGVARRILWSQEPAADPPAGEAARREHMRWDRTGLTLEPRGRDTHR
jgi:signal peptidase I